MGIEDQYIRWERLQMSVVKWRRWESTQSLMGIEDEFKFRRRLVLKIIHYGREGSA